ncbi:CmpA/NrtA family ABC transporter substrate-binding protein [Stenomitos frigidus]|uniref:Bicarbonate-binding protein n=1 Tax=Stenomitos frigidus ULC18 TaxID=2107698 RepID=A0A2T1E0N3_9CYAN|nr:CmpA/NrtA family ABC transporter substrate-binding protein [Stenomitos frigidus]PSB26326.1 bicarbonate-binding protein [Stenomitos frigidus ULC18]
MTQFSRRKFIYTAGVAALGSAAIKGCASAPSTSGGASPVASPAAATGGGGGLETTEVRLGFIPIFEAAPLIIAKEKGFFEKHGVKDAMVIKQSSWGVLRDNTEIGTEGGGIDGGQYQMPMPHLISEGKITKGNKKIPMYTLAQLITHANGIAIANKHLGKGFNMKDGQAKGKAYIESLKAAGTPFTAAHTFPQSNQELWIRYFLGSLGVNPDTDVKLIVIPPAQTVANMKVGTMDGFSTGDPWPYRILADKIGYMAILTAQMWEFHPEEYFAMRADWVDKHPNTTKALLKAIMEAQQWLDVAENRKEAVEILAKKQYINVKADLMLPPMEGNYAMGDGQPDVKDKNKGPLYWKDGKGSVSYPYKSHDLWFLTENVRWGFLPGDTDTKKIVDAVNREDLWKEAAKEAGIAAADIPTETSRGVETFYDGVKFDPKDPSAYLKALKVKKVA